MILQRAFVRKSALETNYHQISMRMVIYLEVTKIIASDSLKQKFFSNLDQFIVTVDKKSLRKKYFGYFIL